MSYADRVDAFFPRRFTRSEETEYTGPDRTALVGDEVRADSDVPELVPVVRINGETFAVRGDISFISGKPKAGKSAVSVGMAASALLPLGHQEDTLCISVLPANGRPVIIVDTEQPKANTKKTSTSICRILGLEPANHPSNLKVYNFRSYKKEEKLLRVKILFETYPDTHLWIIDGLADLIDDVNGATESGKIVDWFMIQATRLNTTIILVVHENPGSDKMRGHLGSEAERKGGGVINVAKNREGNYHTINSKILRNAPDFETVYFSYSQGRRFFVTDGRAAALVCAEKDKDERDLARLCFPEGTDSLRHTELVKRIENLRNVKETAASKWKKRMLACGMIVKREVEQDYILSESLMLDLLPSPGFQADLPLHTPFTMSITSPRGAV
ncbi:AAA family ATPase [Hymenobacter norwichensis]|uniref:AAA family ATPase n=1 Tax=Hymenobacter norwichensis TaxID=223903 RepID=UPI0003B5E055|nr:AAA family ATPase [Hymenobacter norwichensis]